MPLQEGKKSIRREITEEEARTVYTACILQKEIPLTTQDLEYFRKVLEEMLEEAQLKGDSTLDELTESQTVYADPADRATAESDRSFTLRIRDRERKLIHKIQEAIKRLDDGEYGICEECGEEIGVARLKARPVTTLCVACKARQEEGEDIQGS